MKKARSVLLTVCMFFVVTACESMAAQDLDKDFVRKLLSNPPRH